MLKRWNHGHSLIAGAAAGAALTHGVFGAVLLFGAGVAVGYLAGLLWRTAGRVIGYVETWAEVRQERQAYRLAELRRRAAEKPPAGDFGEFPEGY